MSARRFTPAMHEWLGEHIPGHCLKETQARFNAEFPEMPITYKGIKSYATAHRIKTGRPRGVEKGRATVLWPTAAQQFMHEHLASLTYAQAIERLKQLTGHDYTRDQIKAYANRSGLRSAYDGRFVKGQKPLRPCPKGARLSPKTEFKKGHRPHNALEVGAEVVTTDGYRARKIGEPNKWEFIHRRVWEDAHGPIPADAMITFLDGNRLNCELSNLALITKAEHSLLNLIGGRSEDPEITQAAILVTKIHYAQRRNKRNAAQAENRDTES